MTNPGTAVATRPSGITGLILHAAPRLTPMLPDGMTLEQLANIVYFESKKNPALLNCSPDSIVSACARVLRSGLELGETCHLVPFGKTCTFIADYKGLAQLMIAARAVRAVEMEVVREGDEFEYQLGLEAKLRHVPATTRERPVTHAYVILRLPFGASTFKVMAADEINAIRQQYSKSWKAGPLTAWYACKTVLRQIAKTMPKDKRLAAFYAAVAADEREEFGAELSEAEPAQLVSGPEMEDEPAQEADFIDDTDVVEADARAAGELPLNAPRRQRVAQQEGR